MKNSFHSKCTLIWISGEKTDLEQNPAEIVFVLYLNERTLPNSVEKQICIYKLVHTLKFHFFLFSLRPAHFSLSIYFQAFILMVIGLDINDAKTAKRSRAWFSSQPAFNRDCCQTWLPWHWKNFQNSKVILGPDNVRIFDRNGIRHGKTQLQFSIHCIIAKCFSSVISKKTHF